MLNEAGPQTNHGSARSSERPLSAGQKVELGIAENACWSSAVLVIWRRWLDCLLWRLFQVLFANDFASLCGALLGNVGGFLVARGLSPGLAARQSAAAVIVALACRQIWCV